MRPVHPGRLLRRELEARGVTPSALARALRVPADRISNIVNGRRAITPDTALRLARYFGGDQSPRFWMMLQTNYDLAGTEAETGAAIARDVQVAEGTAPA